MIDFNDTFHDEFKHLNINKQIYFPFGNKEFQEHATKSEPCCENMKLENDNGESVCVSSGQVDRYDTVNVDIR